MSAHEFILSEYDSRFTKPDFEKIITDSISVYSENGLFNFDDFSIFLLNNLSLFSDTLLYKQIVDEAIVKYNLPSKYIIEIPYTQAFNKKYFDTSGNNGGYNFFQETRNKTIDVIYEYCSDNIYSFLSDVERENINEILSFLTRENGDLTDVISFIEAELLANNQIFSARYINFLEFTKNNCTFRLSSYSNNSIYWIDEDTIMDGLANLSLYEALEADCEGWSCATVGMITHSEHLAQSAAGSSGASEFVEDITSIRDLISYLF